MNVWQICDGIGQCEEYLTGSVPGGIVVDDQGRIIVVNRSLDTVQVFELVVDLISRMGFEEE